MSLVDALQAALAGEHAAVYGYGVVGGRLEGTAQAARARSGFDTHRVRRTTLRGLVSAAGGEPVVAQPAYDLGGPVVTTAQAAGLAARIELAVAAAFADLVAASQGTERTVPAAWLTDAAVRAAGWSGSPAAFPGLTERAG